MLLTHHFLRFADEIGSWSTRHCAVRRITLPVFAIANLPLWRGFFILSVLLIHGGEIHGRRRAHFAVATSENVHLHDDGSLAGAQNPGDGAGRTDLDRPQVADEQIVVAMPLPKGVLRKASCPAVTSAIVAMSPPCSPPAVLTTRSSTGISMITLPSVDGTSRRPIWSNNSRSDRARSSMPLSLKGHAVRRAARSVSGRNPSPPRCLRSSVSTRQECPSLPVLADQVADTRRSTGWHAPDSP